MRPHPIELCVFFSNARSWVLHILFLHNAVARAAVSTRLCGACALDIGYFRVILVESEGVSSSKFEARVNPCRGFINYERARARAIYTCIYFDAAVPLALLDYVARRVVKLIRSA